MLGRTDIPATAQELVSGVDGLVSLPEVCFLVNDLVNDPNSEIEQIGHVISQDPALTARLLRLVNSSYYGFSNKIETVSRAILMVGLKELQHMVWATTAVETFSGLSPDQANMAGFWRHSIFTAVLSRILARECNILHPERLFVGGLLHDIGRLIFYCKLPQAMEEVLRLEQETGQRDGLDIERQVLGFDHAEVAGDLFESWKLPEALCIAVRHHHDPASTPGQGMESAILHVADVMAHVLEAGDDEGLESACDAHAWQYLNLPVERIKPVLHEAVFQFIEALELLLPGASQRV